ncbi:MAG: P1 family peptidase [Pseudomonadota bacterium]
MATSPQEPSRIWQPGAANTLTDIDGLQIGHADDRKANTGVSVLLFDEPATASVCILGQAPGTRDIALLDPARTVETIDGLVLAGGSAYGLAAVDPVIDALAREDRGFAVGDARVPIVPAAILFDLLNGGAKPTDLTALYRALGSKALKNLRSHTSIGRVGAGFGATTAIGQGGLGSASAVLGNDAPKELVGFCVAALVAANPVGSPFLNDGSTLRAHIFGHGEELKSDWRSDTNLAPSSHSSVNAIAMKRLTEPGQNTTIGCIVTNAPLDKRACHALAVAGQDGIANAIYPAHTALDGDLVVGASVGKGAAIQNPSLLAFLQAIATATMARAIARGILAAPVQ